MGGREFVEAFDSASGESRWRFAYPTTFGCSVAYSAGPYSTPVIDKSRVYAIGAQGQMHCLDLASGQVIWRRSLQEEFGLRDGLFPFGTSPLLEGDRLIVNVGGTSRAAGIVAFDKTTGRTRWTATEDAASFATPVAATIAGRRYLFAFTAMGLAALDPADGRVYWRIPFRPKNPDTIIATSPLVYQDLVLVSSYQAGSLCVRVLAGGGYEERWRDRRVLDSQYNTLVCVDGDVFGFAASDKSLRCLDLDTGELRWKSRTILGRGNSLAVGGNLLVLGQDGHLGCLRADSHRESIQWLSEQPVIPGPCYAAPALAGGRLYVRGNGYVACLDLGRPRAGRDLGLGRGPELVGSTQDRR
jgi:outer membrane protein assembly factor BamB